jgi:hypothetical protein
MWIRGWLPPGEVDVARSPGGIEKSTDKKTPAKAFML